MTRLTNIEVLLTEWYSPESEATSLDTGDEMIAELRDLAPLLREWERAVAAVNAVPDHEETPDEVAERADIADRALMAHLRDTKAAAP